MPDPSSHESHSMEEVPTPAGLAEESSNSENSASPDKPIDGLTSNVVAKCNMPEQPADKHGPPLVEFTRTGWGQTKSNSVLGYIVPGTGGVWAVYENRERKGRWVGLHVLTGLAAYTDFASREEAEDVLCWVWCNALDQKGLHTSESSLVTTAMGARVLSRFKRGGPLKQPRRTRVQKIGQTEIEQTGHAAYFAKRLAEIGAEREAWLREMYSERELLAEEHRLLTLEQTNWGREKSLAQEQLSLRTNELAQSKQELDERRRAVAADEGVLLEQSRDLNVLRRAMFNALKYADIGAELQDGPFGRRLRNIKIKGIYDTELDIVIDQPA